MKVKPFILPALIAVAGIVLLFVLELKIWGILVILLALVYGFVRYCQVKDPAKYGDIEDKVALLNDRFHRARKQDDN